jgi:hypothetical protein
MGRGTILGITTVLTPTEVFEAAGARLRPGLFCVFQAGISAYWTDQLGVPIWDLGIYLRFQVFVGFLRVLYLFLRVSSGFVGMGVVEFWSDRTSGIPQDHQRLVGGYKGG